MCGRRRTFGADGFSRRVGAPVVPSGGSVGSEGRRATKSSLAKATSSAAGATTVCFSGGRVRVRARRCFGGGISGRVGG